MIGGPPPGAVDTFEATLNGLRSGVAARVAALVGSVLDVDDAAGWQRLTVGGSTVTTSAQADAITAVRRLLAATLAAAGDPAPSVDVPMRSGRLAGGHSVLGLFAMTEQVVRNRIAGGATFPEARDASGTYLVGMASSEPHRVGRDAQLATGLTDERFNRFRRVAESGACPWCRMLATRGAVYLTAQTAGRGRRYHPHCRCRAEVMVDLDAIEASKALSGDWHNAILDERLMVDVGAMRQPAPS